MKMIHLPCYVRMFSFENFAMENKANSAYRQQSVPAALCYVFMRVHVLLASNIGVVSGTTNPRPWKPENHLADPCNNESTCSMFHPVKAEQLLQQKESTTSLFLIAKV